MSNVKFYLIIGSFLLVIGLFISSVVYVVMLKNEISDLQQQNLINNEKIQQQELTIKTYTKQNNTLNKTLKRLKQQKQQDIKELKDIDKLVIDKDKQKELLNSLTMNGL